MILLAVSLASQQSLFAEPIDVVLAKVLVNFGWIPVVIVLFWGFIMMWQNYRQGMYVSGLHWVLLSIDVPAMTEQTPKALENLFTNLYGGYSSLTWKEKWVIGKVQPVWSFEIASTEGYIQFYVRTQVRYRDQIEAGIYASYPDAEIMEAEDYTSWAPEHYPNDEGWEVWGSELTTKKEQYLPIRTYVDFEDKISGEIKDPLGQVLEGMARMKPGEHYWYHIMIQPNGNDWKKAGEKFVNKIFGVEEKHKAGMVETGVMTALSVPNAVIDQAFGINMVPGHEEKPVDQWKAFKLTMLEREMVDGVVRKIGKVGFGTKIRMVYIAKRGVFDKNARTAFIKGLLAQYSHLNMNQIGLYTPTTPKDDYFWQRWEYTGKQEKLVKGYKRRSWGIGANPKQLNVEELATLWHFPSITSKPPGVKRAESRRGEAPVGLPYTLEELDITKGPPKTYTHEAPKAAASHDDHGGHGGGHGASASHGGGHGEPVDVTHATEAPPIGLPHEPPMPTATHAAPHTTAPAHHAPVHIAAVPEETVELGLDATDMGPPADVQLPGPPPGWNEASSEEPPSNLPV